MENSPVFQTKGLGEPNPHWDDFKKMVTQSFQLKSCPMSMCKKVNRNILMFCRSAFGKSTLALSQCDFASGISLPWTDLVRLFRWRDARSWHLTPSIGGILRMHPWKKLVSQRVGCEEQKRTPKKKRPERRKPSVVNWMDVYFHGGTQNGRRQMPSLPQRQPPKAAVCKNLRHMVGAHCPKLRSIQKFRNDLSGFMWDSPL